MHKIYKNKRYIAWGVGNAFRNFIEKYDSHIFDYAVDDFKTGTEVYGVDVYHPNKVFNENKEDIYIVIFTLSSNVYQTIAKRLFEHNFVLNRDYSDYSYLIKDSFAEEISQYNIHLKPEWYEVIKSLFHSVSIKNHSSILGTWLIFGLLDATKDITGDIIELGVYEGGNAYASIFMNLVGDKRKYILVDNFEGFKEMSRFDPVERKDMFKENSYPLICDRFNDLRNTKIVRGHIPEVFKQFSTGCYSLVYYDCDLYKPALQSLRHFFDKISTGGLFLIDDYCVSKDFLGVKKAVDEFIIQNNLKLVEIPETTHAIIFKN